MTWYPDMGSECMVAGGEHVRAIGWLHPEYPYPKGDASPQFVERLKEFTRLAIQSIKSLHLPITLGYHGCEFCNRAEGTLNFGVPSGDILFVAPEMIAHYVEQHSYAPPALFVDAVMASPLPGTLEYDAAVEKFRSIHARQMEELPPGQIRM